MKANPRKKFKAVEERFRRWRKKHGCRALYGVTKGAERDAGTMLEHLKKQMADEEYNLMQAGHAIGRLSVKIHRVQDGDLSVWI